MNDPSMVDAELEVRRVLEAWATATRTGRKDDILSGHLPDVVIYDVLPPMKYESAAAYRASWDDWQPETAGEGIFELQHLEITAGERVAFAYADLKCGGTTPSGETFEDLVRATFCLIHADGGWKIAHQHISKPITLNP